MATEIRIPTERKKTELINGQIRQRSVFAHKISDHKELASEIIRSDCMNKGYRVTGKTLGSGAYAKVKLAEVMVSKLARHTSMSDFLENGKIQVAIKVIQKRIVPQEFLRKFLPRELDNHMMLPSHPHVVRCFEHFSSTDFTYMVVEYLNKGDLLDLINQSISRNERGLGEDVTKKFFKQICLGLRHIHQNGIVHRDMKCENILIDENMDVKITDFGFSCRFHDKSTILKTSCGSYAYTAPEVIKNKPYDGVNADIWSIGIILCAMINGRLPYNDGHLSEMDEDMRMQRLRFERSVSFDCMVLIRRMLQYNPILRPPIDDILTDPWMTGKKPIPRQINKPKWSSSYSVNKADDTVIEPKKLRVDGSNLNKPTTPLCYRVVSPNKSKAATNGTDTVVLSKGARETIILKSRRQVYRESPQRRPKTWPKSVKEQAEKTRTEIRSLSVDKQQNTARIQHLLDVTSDRARAIRSKGSANSNKLVNKPAYTPLMYMFKFLQPNGSVEPTSRSPSPKATRMRSTPITQHVPDVRPLAPNPSPCTSPTLFMKFKTQSNEIKRETIDSYGKHIKTERKKKKEATDVLLDIANSPDLDAMEVNMMEMKQRCPPEARSKSVPSSGNRNRSKSLSPERQTPAERARSCRNRVMKGYEKKKTDSSNKEPPLPPLMVQKIDTDSASSPELGPAVEASYRIHTKSKASKSHEKYPVKTVYKYKYH